MKRESIAHMCNAKLAVCFVCCSSSTDKNVQSSLP